MIGFDRKTHPLTKRRSQLAKLSRDAERDRSLSFQASRRRDEAPVSAQYDIHAHVANGQYEWSKTERLRRSREPIDKACGRVGTPGRRSVDKKVGQSESKSGKSNATTTNVPHISGHKYLTPSAALCNWINIKNIDEKRKFFGTVWPLLDRGSVHTLTLLKLQELADLKTDESIDSDSSVLGQKPPTYAANIAPEVNSYLSRRGIVNEDLNSWAWILSGKQGRTRW